MGKKTHEEFALELQEKNDKVKLIGTYTGCDNDVTVQCVKNPEHIWDGNPSNLLNNSGCPFCKYKNKNTTEGFNKMLPKYRTDVKMIGEYIDLNTETEFQCLNDELHIFPATPKSIKGSNKDKGKQCPFCKEINIQLVFLRKLEEKNPDVIALESYTNSDTLMRFGCKYNAEHEWNAYPYNILKGTGCPHCFKETGKYLNNNNSCLWDDRPDLAVILENPEDGYKYSYGSGIDLWWICQDCGERIKRKPNYVSYNGLCCKVCSQSYSYPNKFMYNILKQLNIDFIPEYKDTWTNDKIYDFYFIINGQKYIIEMDGAFHFVDAYNSCKNAKENDLLKDQLAMQQNIKVIRIDCNYGEIKNRYDYIKNNVIISELINILDLNNVNFEDANLYAQTSNLKIVVSLWNKGTKTLRGISAECGYGIDNISRLLKTASKTKLIDESYDELCEIIKQEGYRIVKEKAKKNPKGTPVKCNETGEVFRSAKLAIDKYKDKKIYACIRTNPVCKYAGRLEDGTKLTWTKITLVEYEEIINNRALTDALF